MNYACAVKFNISLTRLDMYTSSTESLPPPGPSSTAGNELLRVVCRLTIHTYRTKFYALHFQKLHNLGVLQDTTAQGEMVTEYYVMSCSTLVTWSLPHYVYKHDIWVVICIACSLQLRAIIILVFTYSSVLHIACNVQWSVNIGIIYFNIVLMSSTNITSTPEESWKHRCNGSNYVVFLCMCIHCTNCTVASICSAFKSNLLHSKSFHIMYASAVSLKHLNVFLSSPHCWYGGFNSGGGRPPIFGGRSGGSGSEGEEKEGNGERSTVSLQSRGQSK